MGMWGTYLTDIHTGRILQPIDIPSFSWTVSINDSSLSATRTRKVGAGDVQSVTLPWTGVPGRTQYDRLTALQPGKRGILLVWRTTQQTRAGLIGTPILWGGIASRTDSLDSTTINLSSVYSMLANRYMVRENQYHNGTSTDTISFTGMSLRGIASEVGYLCTSAKPGGELPVDWTYRGERHTRHAGEDGTIHTRTYQAWNISNANGKTIMDDLASVEGGPDMQWRPYITSDGMHVRLKFIAGSDDEPYLGQHIVRGYSMYLGGGTIENLTVSYLAPIQRVYATGAGQDQATLTALAQDLTDVTGSKGMMLGEAVYQDQNVNDVGTLASHAKARLQAADKPLMQLQGEIHFDDPYVPQPGDVWPGQLVGISLAGFPALPDGTYHTRIMQMSGDSSDKATILFDAMPVPELTPSTPVQIQPLPPNPSKIIRPVSITVTGLPSSIDLYKDKTRQYHLTAIIKPSDTTDRTVAWTVDGPATIDQTGLLILTGKTGTVTVTGTCAGDFDVYTTATLKVTDSTPILPTSVEITGLPEMLDVYTDKTRSFTLSTHVLPENTTDKSVVWSVTGPATITGETLTLTGKKGVVVVTATCNADKRITAQWRMRVLDSTPIPPTSITISGLPTAVDLYKTAVRDYPITYTVQPSDATNKTCKWTITGPATLDGSTVRLTGKTGTVTLTLTSNLAPTVTATATLKITDSTPIMPTSVTIQGMPDKLIVRKGKSNG